MNFSLNSKGGNINGKTANGIRSEKNEELEMKNANMNIQMNIGNSGTLAIKNTAKLLGGLALAGMVAMAATFGSVSADTPSVSASYMVHGPNAMDVEFLNKLTSKFMVHGPNGMDVEYLNKLGRVSSLGAEYIQDFVKTSPTASKLSLLGPDYINDFVPLPKVSSANVYLTDDYAAPFSMTPNVFRTHGPDAVDFNAPPLISAASIFQPYGPDAVDFNAPPLNRSANVFRIHGPDVVEQSSASTYLVHGPDTSEWIG